jgi:hypothetical protein
MASGVTGTPDLSTALRLRFFKQQQSQVEHLMTEAERQEIRERHFLWKERECNYDGDPYPCDVIKVLDATEMWYKS